MLEINTKKMEYYKKMKKRRKVTYSVLSIILLILLYLLGKKIFFKVNKNENIEYIKTVANEEYDISYLKSIQQQYEESLNIIDEDYEFAEQFEAGNDPEVLVYHHTAADNLTPQEINKQHIERGFGGIGYHFYIRKDGKIYRGRPEKAVGAHAIGRNKSSIGICLEGNFEKESLTDAEKSSLVKLSVDMIIKYNLKDSIGHRDVYGTLCPGENFPMDEVKKEVMEELLKLNKK